MNTKIANSRVTRRRFLAAAGAALAIPVLIPSRLHGAESPAARITLGVVGCGNMGTSNLRAFLRQKGCQVVAACEVDRQHLTQAVNLVNRQYQNKDPEASQLLTRPLRAPWKLG